MRPKPTPKTVSTISAMKASFIVIGNACARTSLTGRPENDVPKSSVKMPFRYSRYC
ncbi:hypothetical protein D9M70_597430 [compost metagenome]